MERTITVTLKGDEVFALAHAVLDRMSELTEQESSPERDAQLRALGSFARKTLPFVAQEAVIEQKLARGQLN